MSLRRLDLLWLLEHTVPVPGERGAALESWFNVLADAGFEPVELCQLLDVAERRWRDHPWRHTDGCEVER